MSNAARIVVVRLVLFLMGPSAMPQHDSRARIPLRMTSRSRDRSWGRSARSSASRQTNSSP